MTRVGLVLGISALLAACGSAPTRQAFPHHFTLTGATVSATHVSRSGRDTLRVARIAVPAWLAGSAMYYRLDYAARDQLAAYTQSDWIAPPAQLLQALLIRTLAADGGWRIVTGPADPAQTDYSLHVRLDDFSQAFSGPRQSVAVLDASATLVDERDTHAVAQRHFHIAVPSPSADAAGGAAALNQASRQFARALQAWLATTHQRAKRATR